MSDSTSTPATDPAAPADQAPADQAAPVEQAPADQPAPADESAPVEPVEATPEVGSVVFFEVEAYGETEPVTHAGLVVHAADGRVRVKDLGAAAESADFPAHVVRLDA